MTDQTRRPSEWETELGIEIQTPDGWIEEQIPWYEEITEKKFLSLAAKSSSNYSEYYRRNKR